MRFLIASRRWLRFFLMVAVLLLTSSMAYAAVSVNKTVPAGVTVNLQSNPEGALGFYSDSGGAIPVTTLNFGELKPGVTGATKVYIKNLTGTTTFQYFTASDDLLKGSAAISPYNLNLTPLTSGNSRSFDVFLNLDPDITPGLYQFNITVTASTQ